MNKQIFSVIIVLLLSSGCGNEKKVGGDSSSAEIETTISSGGIQKITPRPTPDPYPTY